MCEYVIARSLHIKRQKEIGTQTGSYLTGIYSQLVHLNCPEEGTISHCRTMCGLYQILAVMLFTN